MKLVFLALLVAVAFSAVTMESQCELNCGAGYYIGTDPDDTTKKACLAAPVSGETGFVADCTEYSGAGGLTCQLCADGKYFDGTKCETNPTTVTDCVRYAKSTTIVQCIECPADKQKLESTACVARSEIADCAEYSLTGTCVKCTGKVLNTLANDCTTALPASPDANCEVYTTIDGSNSVCSICKDTHYKNASNECVANPTDDANCQSFDAEGKCVGCKTGFYQSALLAACSGECPAGASPDSANILAISAALLALLLVIV